MILSADPRTALTLAAQRQADVRAVFPRRPGLPFVFARPTPRRGGITAVPALPGDAAESGTTREPHAA